MNLQLQLILITSTLLVKARANQYRMRMSDGAGCGLACYRYNKCLDNSSSSSDGNLSIRPGYLIFRKCSDPPAQCSCRDNQEVRVSSTTPLPVPVPVPVARNPYPPQNDQDIFCSSRWFFSCWVQLRH